MKQSVSPSFIEPDSERLLPSGDEAGTAPEDRAFRPDVQGMRAVAVVLVVCAHVGIPRMGYGVIGVDVFFVISGFVITGILLRERAATGHTGLVAFYGRRARRIIPMAVLVIAVVVVVDRIVDGAVLTSSVAINGRWDALFQGNVGYFQGLFHDTYSGPPSPPGLGGLAVYWSLSVEEQFYLVYPALLILIATGRNWGSLRTRLSILMAGVFIASFAYSFSVNPSIGAYVSTLARVWELAIGGLLAVGALWWRRLPIPAAAAMTWIGLGGLLLLVLDSQHIPAWPRSMPLLPVLATSLVIAGGTAAPRFGAEALLKLAPFKWLALWSFSLYLWHKPIYVWAVQAEGGHLSLWGDVVVIGIAVVVSAVSYSLIENPIRHSSYLKRSGGISLALGLSLIASCVLLTLAVQHL
jgi:peptidoglycan/LPS O-acetylase OafA/YrhL